ncbi:MAG: hypothetical protein ACXAE3_17420 [Candidatus Kariarchaeaceae archaeon]
MKLIITVQAPINDNEIELARFDHVLSFLMGKGFEIINSYGGGTGDTISGRTILSKEIPDTADLESERRLILKETREYINDNREQYSARHYDIRERKAIDPEDIRGIDEKYRRDNILALYKL